MLLKFFQREQQRNRRRVGLEREGSALEDLTIAFLQALNAPALWILKGLKKEKGRERFTDSRSR